MVLGPGTSQGSPHVGTDCGTCDDSGISLGLCLAGRSCCYSELLEQAEAELTSKDELAAGTAAQKEQRNNSLKMLGGGLGRAL